MAAIAIAVTVVAALMPARGAADAALPLRVTLQTVIAMMAVPAAALLARRCLTPHRVYLALAAGSLAISALVVVGLLTVSPDSGVRVPVDEGGALAAAALLAIAAWAPGASRGWAAPLAVTALVIASSAAVAAASAVHIAAALAFAAAAAGFVRRGDALAPFIAAGAALGLLAEVNDLIVPPGRAEVVHLADVLRLLFVAALLLGALTEAVREWRRAADAAVRRERRRIARDLHDGVTQELVYIERRAGRLADTALGREIAAAAERALHDSRRIVGRLSDHGGESLHTSLAAIAARNGVVLDLRAPADLPRESREAVVRIAAEAVRNAARHGRAEHVRVDLDPGPPLRLSIVDDGAGFEPGTVRPNAYGLIGMRDRAEELGGAMRLRSRSGRGTEIEVELP